MSAQPNLPTSLPTPLTHLPTNSGERSRTLTVTKYQKHGYFSTSSATMANKCEHRVWRREWDSNPRYGFPHTRFPSVRLKPLGHLSGWPVLKGPGDFCKGGRPVSGLFPQPIE